MLCLARKTGESIVIQTKEGNIRITITDIYKSSKVRLGLFAPESITIDREEIYLAKQKSAAERAAREQRDGERIEK